MREVLAELIATTAESDPSFIALSGDHGYALFDPLRSRRPEQFVNAGIMEQAMVGMAAGLAKLGFKPMVYGLSAFVPLRVLEQIKMDVCYSSLPVIFIGDGAGLVYSTLGASHQCGEDIAALRPIPNIRIYSPCDAHELSACFEEARSLAEPAYIRVGKSDRSLVNAEAIHGTEPYFTFQPDVARDTCIVSTGSMVSVGSVMAKEHQVACVSVPRIKPFPSKLLEMLHPFRRLLVLEEHSRYGGLASALTDALVDRAQGTMPQINVFCLQDHFSKRCGSYQYALSEHELSDSILRERLALALNSSASI